MSDAPAESSRDDAAKTVAASSHGLLSESAATAVVRGRRVSPIWLVPLVAAGVVIYLVYGALSKRGPVIAITFNTADGLSVQQTQVKHKAVALGTVDDIRLSDDMKSVIVRVRMEANAKRILTDRARFWVVRPRLTAAAVSGLETLVSGVYIEVDPGLSGGRAQRTFKGLEEPPSTRPDEPGHTYVLNTDRLRSLAPGAPVFFRDVNVGEMINYDLGGGAGPVAIRIFVRSPYDAFVRSDSRFWNASGASLTMGDDGIHFEVESIQAILSGGIAFSTPESAIPDPPSADDAVFRLYPDHARAEADLFRKTIPCIAYFQSSVRALAPGSAVELFGVQVGSVTDVRVVDGNPSGHLSARVAFDLQPERLAKGAALGTAALPSIDVQSLVAQGMRAVLESSSLLTGQKVLSLQYVPGAPGIMAREGDALVLPSQSGGMENITMSLSDVATKLDQIPFEQIGNNLNRTLEATSKTIGGPAMKKALTSVSDTMVDVRHLVQQADAGMTPLLARLPEISEQLQQAVQKANATLGEGGYGQNSDLQRGLERLVDQVNDAARTIRVLADFLGRHPESLLRGRSAQAGER